MRRRVWGVRAGLGVVKKYNEYVAMFREKFLPALKKECCIEDGNAGSRRPLLFCFTEAEKCTLLRSPDE